MGRLKAAPTLSRGSLLRRSHVLTRAAIPHRTTVIYLVGDFILDPAHRQLTCGGVVVALTDPYYAVFECLVVHWPAFVTKDKLAKVGWGGHVSDNGVEQAISALRKALGHSARTRYIETERRRGYRIAVEVRRVEPDDLAIPGVPLGDDVIRRVLQARRELATLRRAPILNARQTLEAIVAEHPRYVPALVALSHACALTYEATRFDRACDLEDPARAVNYAREALAIDPACGDAWSSLGFALHLCGRPAAAVEAIWRAKALEPASWRHFVRLGFVSWGEERIEAAQSALALRPDQVLAHWEKSTVLIARGTLDVALAHLQSACLAQNAQHPDGERYRGIGTLLLRALVLAAQERPAEADQALDAELAQASSDHIYAQECAANCWYLRGGLWLRRGDTARADAAFEQARVIAPGHFYSIGALGLPMPEFADDDPRAFDIALGRAIGLVRAGRHREAALIVAKALAAATRPELGWILPVEPMLRALTRPEIWGDLLKLVRQRAT